MTDIKKPREKSELEKLAEQCLADSDRWFGDTNGRSIAHHALAMAGEVGEFCNIVKKIDRGSLNIRDAKVRVDLAMELTDVLVYLLNLAGMLGVDLQRTYEVVRRNNEQRFTAERREREARRSDQAG